VWARLFSASCFTLNFKTKHILVISMSRLYVRGKRVHLSDSN